MKQHNIRILDEVNEWKHISLQQSSIINMKHFLQQNENNDNNDKNNEK